MESNLSERYNNGVVPPPELAEEPAPLQYPTWQPTPAQVETARKRLGLNIAIMALLVCACLSIIALIFRGIH
ncbi:MAG: hypothetical protein EHM81_07710 [Chloroflexi bacterium]|nr:MAG: hypothetical protein EHM81_07710 [Chloroflexota bacterium]